MSRVAVDGRYETPDKFAVVRYQVGSILTTLVDVEKRLRAMDTRIDKAELTDQRVSILAGMLSPSERDKSARELERLECMVSQLRKDVDHQLHIHNSRHIPVSDTRKAE